MKVVYLALISVILFATLNSQGDVSMFLFNEEKSNFVAGIGNISYPTITHETQGQEFKNSNSICVSDINGDGKKEIIAVSVPEWSLKVYNENLSLIWSFYDNNYQKWNVCVPDMDIEGGISSLALTDIDGDGVKDIIFSISPCVGPINTTSGTIAPRTTLYAFKGDGSELWNITLNGSITAHSLVVSDIDGDGINEIIVGSDNLYVLNLQGKCVFEYSLDEFGIRNIYSVIAYADDIVFTFWHHMKYNSRTVYISGREVYDTYFSMEKISFQNDSFNLIWSNILEEPKGILGPNFYTMFSDSNFSAIYLVQTMPSALLKINEESGIVEWKKNSKYVIPPDLVVSVLPNKIIWNEIEKISVIDATGKTIHSFFIHDKLYVSSAWSTVSVFDINNDNKNEIILIDKNGMLAFDMDGTKLWEINLWPKVDGYWSPAPPILHSDTDNDGFDEIITTDPEGRIVIIDNGSPPEENNGISVEMLAFTGIGAIITATVVIWIWRKRND